MTETENETKSDATPSDQATGAPGAESTDAGDTATADPASASAAEEDGGPEGPDPTRFGDWERKGRCIDF
jgi:hypothetical protein